MKIVYNSFGGGFQLEREQFIPWTHNTDFWDNYLRKFDENEAVLHLLL